MNQEQTKINNDQSQLGKEFEEYGDEAVKRIKELVEEGQVRRLVIRKPDNDVLLDVPLMPALVVGGIVTFWMPYLTIVVFIAACVAKFKLEIVQTEAVDEHAESLEITS